MPVSNFSAFRPQVWAKDIIDRIDQTNVAMNFVDSRYEGQIRNGGDRVWVRTFGDVTISSYERGQSIASQQLDPVKEPLDVDDSAYWSFDLDDLDEVQNDIDARAGYVDRAGVGMANEADTYIFAAYDQALSANQISNGGSAIDVSADTDGTALYQLAVKANRKLNEQNVSQRGRWLVLNPYAFELANLSKNYFVRASALGDLVVTSARFAGTSAQDVNGFVGQMQGFDVYLSTNLPQDANGTYLLYGQGKPIHYAAAIPPGRVQAIPLENTFATRVRGLMLHGKAVFAENKKRLGYIYVDKS
jgi:hypothetical protein